MIFLIIIIVIKIIYCKLSGFLFDLTELVLAVVVMSAAVQLAVVKSQLVVVRWQQAFWSVVAFRLVAAFCLVQVLQSVAVSSLVLM
jgi:hypothetical protein